MNVVESHTRFLFPFLVGRGKLDEISNAITEPVFGQDGSLWELEENVPEQYEDNALPFVNNRLFSSSHGIGRYFNVSSEVVKEFFDSRLTEKFNSLAIQLSQFGGIELFLTHYGAGVLSISLASTPEDCVTLRNLTSDLHRTIEGIRNTAILERNSSRDSSNETARWFVNKGCDPNNFKLWEFRDALLSPLVGNPAIGFRRLVDSFRVFSVVRMDQSFDLSESECLGEGIMLLEALQNHWPADHPGVLSTFDPSNHLIVNGKHLAGASHAGSAHILGDQTNVEGNLEHPYNQKRLPWVFQKYFFQYLLATTQRMAIYCVKHDAVEIMRESKDILERADQLSALRTTLMDFAVEGEFSQLQTSSSTNDFYKLSRKQLDIPLALREIRETFAEIDSRESSRKQQVQSEKTTQSLNAIAHIQSKIEWVEVFLIVVYALEMAHLMFGAFGIDHSFFVGVWYLVLAGVTTVAAFFALRPDKIKTNDPHSGWSLTPIPAVVIAIATLLVGLVIAISTPGFGEPNHGKQNKNGHMPMRSQDHLQPNGTTTLGESNEISDKVTTTIDSETERHNRDVESPNGSQTEAVDLPSKVESNSKKK